MANRHRAEVDASVFGSGATLRLTTMDCAEIEERYGEGWLHKLLVGLDAFSAKAVKTVVEFGLRNSKGSKVPLADLVWPDGVALSELAPLCSDAVLLAVYGKGLAEMREEAAAKAKAKTEAADAEADPQTASAAP